MAPSYPPFGTYDPNTVQRRLIALSAIPPFNRGMLRQHMARMVLAAGQGRVDVAFRGGAFRVHGDDHPIEYGLLLNRAYNAGEIDFLLQGLPQGGTAVDLGANVGLYSIPLAFKAGRDGRVIAIDASAAFLERLAFNAAASGLANITVENVAVGDREGTARLDTVAGNPGTATTAEDPAGTIRMRPLLAVLLDAGVSRVDVLKVDIDGSEDAALVPFFNTAPATLLPRRIVVEHLLFQGSGSACLAALEARGYRLAGKTRSNSLYELKA